MEMKLTLLRHGESTWNQQNLFTGWTDVPLSKKGVAEAVHAGNVIQEEHFAFDIAYSSVLTRANETLYLVLQACNQLWIPTVKSWRLNERHYGALQGLNKADTAEQYGDKQVAIWRRSFDTPPPPLETTDPRHALHDRRYQGLDAEIVPQGESLKMTLERVLPFWQDAIAPDLLAGKHVLVVAHGNSLRALIKHIEHLDDEEVMQIELPTGAPLHYRLDAQFNIIAKKKLLDKSN